MSTAASDYPCVSEAATMTTPMPTRLLPISAHMRSQRHTAVHARANRKAGASSQGTNDVLFASLRCGRRVGRRGPSRPDRGSTYRLIRRPAFAEIVGEGRPRTVLMISLLSMPCR